MTISIPATITEPIAPARPIPVRPSERILPPGTATAPMTAIERSAAAMGEAAEAPRTSPLSLRVMAEDMSLARSPEDWAKFERALCGGSVDLNPHQIDAALFAFKSPLSRGAILADEVGLGKTIEAGLVMAQLWAEGRRRILVVAPCVLRKQWQTELAEKFGLPSLILERATAGGAGQGRNGRGKRRGASPQGGTNPFMQDRVVITSYEFAYRRRQDLARAHGGPGDRQRWDLIVFDEAHRLRGVYRKSSKTARALRDATAGESKLLLTATPLQNSLMELHGLVQFVDDRLLGPEDAFRSRYCTDDSGRAVRNIEQLRERLSAVVCRVLRRQVREYVRFTERHKLTVDFTPSRAERDLYDKVSDYLRRGTFGGVGTSQRALMLLIYRKLLGSSSHAVAGTLARLEEHLGGAADGKAGAAPAKRPLIETMAEDLDGIEADIEEIASAAIEESPASATPAPGSGGAEAAAEEEDPFDADAPAQSPAWMQDEAADEATEVSRLRRAAEAIQRDAKGEALAKILPQLFARNREKGYPEKAVIFTESRRTQAYLLKRLSEPDCGFAGQISILNGDNRGPEGQRAYRRWLASAPPEDRSRTESPEAAVRQALIHEFRTRSKILISTEAGGEGLNLQFCNLVMNYDLPWNPQRIEQRIGRCHRYGQRWPVLVVNFLNTRNAAEQRIYELLDQKFQLFEGLFGCSDEVLGALSSGGEFERRVLDIHQQCRTEAEYEEAFRRLRAELDEEIKSHLRETREKLIENFDEDVRARLRVVDRQAREHIDGLAKRVATLVVSGLGPDAAHADPKDPRRIVIERVPESLAAGLPEAVVPGVYSVGGPRAAAPAEDGNASSAQAVRGRLTIGHPLVDAIIARAVNAAPLGGTLRLAYTAAGHKVSLLEPLLGRDGLLAVVRSRFEGLVAEERLSFAGIVRDGQAWTPLGREVSEKLAGLAGELEPGGPADVGAPPLSTAVRAAEAYAMEQIQRRNEKCYDKEMDKLETYAEEALADEERRLARLEEEWKAARRSRDAAASFEKRREARKEIHRLEVEFSRLRDRISKQRSELFQEKETRMSSLDKRLEDAAVTRKVVAAVRWTME